MTSFREGRIRCSAAFSHAILLGSFSASIAPLALMQWRAASTSSSRFLFLFGFVCAIYVTIASASSGPLIALAAGVFAYMMFRYRKHLGKATILLVLVAIVLHIVMKAPVWHLISRIDVAGGSTGYHRYRLIDETINHFSEWALTGVHGVAHWGIHAGDVTSMYIAQAVSGGLLTFTLFIVLMAKTMRTYWLVSLSAKDARARYLTWAFFAFVFSHAVSFISVAYFGQIYMLLILTFSLASVLRNKQFWQRHQAQVAHRQNESTPLQRTN